MSGIVDKLCHVNLVEADDWCAIYVGGDKRCEFDRSAFRTELLEVLDAVAGDWGSFKVQDREEWAMDGMPENMIAVLDP